MADNYLTGYEDVSAGVIARRLDEYAPNVSGIRNEIPYDLMVESARRFRALIEALEGDERYDTLHEQRARAILRGDRGSEEDRT